MPSSDSVPSLSKLSISTSKKGKAPVADSWEDDISDPDTETEDNKATPAPLAKKERNETPSAPPPTPASPRGLFSYDDNDDEEDISSQFHERTSHGRSTGHEGPLRRPEKSTAVAGRLIAGALGVKAPRRTEEQRAYDKAIREAEMKKREKEKMEAKRKEEEKEHLKKAVWDD